ncbi:NADH-quinone oxidoreductase subunit C [Streptomyces diastaticus]|uniref:NADH-ubiquinone oxidoreductase chain C n=2 Tax=Streptomyces TaxID=1883 RepID=A0A380PC23_STRGR|nr:MULTISPECIES: NADH-quinone oxidoreductase subunit C [Streptomyces]WSU37378.1 NADH-quinone oxidoreductase subunit C [Streptomyces gougerotii]GFH70858.1 dehydrogenase [Streptomyces diastaticus subsp. diastaticus]GGU21818.1 dehydrogenase [Streptomyces diastaticus subsp. diastaticus]SUP62062.1 NADH-ubiquinone oxidoreductase chain C [Streptomyces griseus]
MTGWLPRPADTLFGPDARAGESYGVLTVDVPAESWTGALRTARSVLGCTFFDWLSAVDEPGTGFLVSAHLVALAPVRRLLLRTTVPHEAPVLESAVEVFAGAAWHERETHEMFGVAFTGHPALEPLLLPENFEGHPLRKDFVLAARVAKAWPGAKEPGEGPDHAGPKRRQMLPPGVPDPNEWGPLKGTLPAAPARPARRAATADGTRPPRRTRTTTEGSASQGPAASASGATPTTSGAPEAPARPRRDRSASQGSASQQAAGPQQPADLPPAAADTPGASAAPGASARSAVEGQAQAPARPRRDRSASQGSASQQAAGPAESGKPAGAPAPSEAVPPPERTSGPTAAPEPSEPQSPASERPEAPEAPADPSPEAPGRPAARPRRNRSAADGSASQQRPPVSGSRPARAGSSDAPWHHARPAHEEAPPVERSSDEPRPGEAATEPTESPTPDPGPEAGGSQGSEARAPGTPASEGPASREDGQAPPGPGPGRDTPDGHDGPDDATPTGGDPA